MTLFSGRRTGVDFARTLGFGITSDGVLPNLLPIPGILFELDFGCWFDSAGWEDDILVLSVSSGQTEA